MPVPRIIDLLSSTDPRDDIHRVVQALAEGEVAVLPLDSTYVATALASHPQGPARLAELALPDTEGCLVLTSVAAAADFLPPLTEFQARLLSKTCPSAVVFRFPDALDHGLGAELPAAAGQQAAPGGELQFAVTGDEITREVLRLLPAPLLARVPTAQSAVAGDPREQNWEGAADVVVDAGPFREAGLPTTVRVDGDAWKIVRPGQVPVQSLQASEGTTILFVCTGNTCRSPMAEAVFRKLLAARLQCGEDELPARGFRVASAGLAAAPGMSASPEAVELVEQLGGRLQRHQSQPLTSRMLNQADFVFTMTNSHRMTIVNQYPELSSRVRTLTPDGEDVSDPIGQGMAEYRRCLEQITESLEAILDRLLDCDVRE